MDAAGTFQLVAQAIAAMLLGFVWQAVLIGGVHELLVKAFPKMPAQQRYLLAMTALMAMAASAVGTLVTHLSSRALEHSPAIGRSLSSARLLSGTPAGALWIVALWLSGVGIMVACNLSGLRGTRRLASDARPPPGWLGARFRELASRMNASRVVLRLHPGIDGPLVVGAIRAVVYLPLTVVTSLSADQLDAVLAHELGHAIRADYGWNLFQRLMEALFFFHPMVWRIGRIAREQRELCCDDVAVGVCSDPSVYASALLALEELRRTRLTGDAVFALGMKGEPASMLHRIRRVLDAPCTLERGPTFAPMLALFASMLIALAFQLPVSARSAGPERDAHPSANTSASLAPKNLSSTWRALRNTTTRDPAPHMASAKPPASIEHTVPPAEQARNQAQAIGNGLRRQHPVSPEQRARDALHAGSQPSTQRPAHDPPLA
jgi:beta-lactamase regulating signal transducer with metallopeptidase domain